MHGTSPPSPLRRRLEVSVRRDGDVTVLRATGERLADVVRDQGGIVLTGHEALGAERTADGLWRVTLRRLRDGATVQRLTRALVIATGGHQLLDRLTAQRIAGAPLVEGLAYEPVVAEGVAPDPEGWEQEIAVPWWWFPDQLDQPVVASGPDGWRCPGPWPSW